MGAPTARGRTVSGAVSLPSRGAFHLSLTVLVRYRSQGSVQAWMVVHPASARVSRARAYSGTRPRPACGFAYGALTRCGRPSHAVPPATAGARPGRQPRDVAPYNTGGANAAARMRSPVWPSAPFARRYSGHLVIDFSSSGYLDVSVPPVPLPAPMSSGRGCRTCVRRVPPFGYPRIEGRVRLPGDYRGLPRPSSAPCAKASAVRPWYLAGPSGPAPRSRAISALRGTSSSAIVVGQLSV